MFCLETKSWLPRGTVFTTGNGGFLAGEYPLVHYVQALRPCTIAPGAPGVTAVPVGTAAHAPPVAAATATAVCPFSRSRISGRPLLPRTAVRDAALAQTVAIKAESVAEAFDGVCNTVKRTCSGHQLNGTLRAIKTQV
jgi:hypothetical protein